MFRRLVTLVTTLALALPLALPYATGTAAAVGNPAAPDGTPASSSPAQNVSPATRKLDKLAVLGRSTQVRPFTSVQRSTFEGATSNLVSTATGNLSFSITDLIVHGPMPFMFQRYYASDNTADTGLGVGWSFAFDDRIELDGDAATLVNGAGSHIAFRRVGQTPRFVLMRPEPISHKSFELVDGDTIKERTAAYARVYKKLGGVYRLSLLTDHNGNTVTYSFDSRHNITRIAGNNGGLLSFEWAAGKDAALLSVTDQAGRKVSFKQDGQRQRTFVDTAGQSWTYDYEAGRLTRAADPLKRALLRVTYDRSGHVTMLGDGAGASAYEYAFNAGGISQRTVASDPLGAKTTYEHNALGKLLTTTTDAGQTVAIEYNASNHPVRVSNAQGEDMRFEYDAQDRLTRRYGSDGSTFTNIFDEQGRVAATVNGGVRTDYVLDARGNIAAAKSNDTARSYTSTSNARGELTSITAADQSVLSYEYDAAGNKTATVDPSLGRTENTYNAAGLVVSRRTASGLTVKMEYDAGGRLVKKSDDKGHGLTIERDASGSPVGLTAANGNSVRATRDSAGRISSVTSSVGKTRTYAYDSRGALADYTDAGGKNHKLKYDGRGRLTEMKDSNGTRTTVERDEKGKARRVVVTDETTSARHVYDMDGNLLNGERPALGAAFQKASFMRASFTTAEPTAPAAPAQWGGYGDPFGSMWNFDGFWDAGNAYGTFCNDGGLFDNFWGGSFSTWGFFDPFGGFGGFNSGWFDWDVSWGGSWHGDDFGGYYDNGGWDDGGYDDDPWGGGGGRDPYAMYNTAQLRKTDRARPKSNTQVSGGATIIKASYGTLPTRFCAFGETCGECVDRGNANCGDNYATCRAAALAATLGIAGGVALTGTVTVGIGTIIGGIILLGGEAAALYSCNRSDNTCRRNVRSGCSMC